MRVISIGGASRSGSTLLAALLGRTEGFLAVGELRYIWSRGYVNNELCGSGIPFRECDFWQAVLHEVYGGPEKVPIAEVVALHRSVAQMWHLPLLMARKKTRRFEARLRDYLTHLEGLVTADSRRRQEGPQLERRIRRRPPGPHAYTRRLCPQVR